MQDLRFVVVKGGKASCSLQGERKDALPRAIEISVVLKLFVNYYRNNTNRCKAKADLPSTRWTNCRARKTPWPCTICRPCPLPRRGTARRKYHGLPTWLCIPFGTLRTLSLWPWWGTCRPQTCPCRCPWTLHLTRQCRAFQRTLSRRRWFDRQWWNLRGVLSTMNSSLTASSWHSWCCQILYEEYHLKHANVRLLFVAKEGEECLCKFSAKEHDIGLHRVHNMGIDKFHFLGTHENQNNERSWTG